MIVLFDEFLPEVLPLAPGCPNIVALNAVRNAAIEFCERSRFWKADLADIAVTANVSTYDLVATDARVIQIMRAAIDGDEIHPRTSEWLDGHVEDWRTYGQVPQFYFQPNPDQITLAALPDADYTLTLNASLCPKRIATGIEQYVVENHLETIASGAIARLLAMPGYEWSNPDAALYHAGKFNSGTASANVESAKGFSRAPIRTTGYSK